MKIKRTAIIVTLLFSVLNLWAAPADVKSIVNSKYYDELMSKGVVTIYKDDGSNNLDLIPVSNYSDSIKQSLVKKDSKNYPFTYESIYYKTKAELLKTSNSSAKDISIDDISKVCRSVSKMEGMTYYSSTRKKEVVLYEKAYMLDGPEGNKIPDQTSGDGNGQISYCMQDDNSFGECFYKLSYLKDGNQMLAVFENTSIIGLGPFKAIYPGMLKINILVIDCGEDILLYLCCDLDSVKYPGIKAQITDSMTSRMEAVYRWFIKQF